MALLATPKGFQPGYLFRSIEQDGVKLTVSIPYITYLQ